MKDGRSPLGRGRAPDRLSGRGANHATGACGPEGDCDETETQGTVQTRIAYGPLGSILAENPENGTWSDLASFLEMPSRLHCEPPCHTRGRGTLAHGSMPVHWATFSRACCLSWPVYCGLGLVQCTALQLRLSGHQVLWKNNKWLGPAWPLWQNSSSSVAYKLQVRCEEMPAVQQAKTRTDIVQLTCLRRARESFSLKGRFNRGSQQRSWW